MDKLALVLAVAALAIGGWTMFGTGSEPDRLAELETLASQNQALLASLKARVETLAEAGHEAGDPLTAAPRARPAGSGTPGLAPARPATTPERLAQLESLVQKQNEQLASMQEKLDKEPRLPGRMYGSFKDRFIHDMSSAQRVLDLDSRQRAEIDRVVEGTRAELEQLYATPNDEGQTWKAAGQINFTKALAGGKEDGVMALMADATKLHKFKKSKIPGSNETFEEADRRIRDQGKQQVREALNPEQQKKWDEAHTDPLFGGSRGAQTAISFSTSVSVEEDD